MGHKPNQDVATVKTNEKKAASALRTPAERLAAVRSSLADGCLVSVTRDDQKFLLQLYDDFQRILNQAIAALGDSNDTIRSLNAQIEQFRTVYEQENSRTSIKVERVAGERELPNAESEIGHQRSWHL